MTESMPVSTPQRSPKRSSAGSVVVNGVLGFFDDFYFLPRVVMLLTSFKTMEDVRGGTILSLPETFTLDP